MSVPLEHDYIGLSEPCSMEKTSDKMLSSSSSSSSVSSTVSAETERDQSVLNLKETELRLGLPGSEPPERKSGQGVALFGRDLKDESQNGVPNSALKSFVSGAKRGFSDAIDGSGKWVLSMNGGSEVDLAAEGNGGSKDNSVLQSSVKGSGSNTVKPADVKKDEQGSAAPAPKAQVVGWPPIRSYRKNTLASNLSKQSEAAEKSGSGCLYVKVSMDGAPYLRKVNLKTYSSYAELSSALEKMFSCFTIGQCASQGLSGQDSLTESRLTDLLHGSEYVLTYEDKDGDWMLVGDVPWEMFTDTCKRLRIMKGSEAIGLAPRAMKSKNQN